MAAIEISSSTGSKEWYWVFTDHLGSITSLVRESDGQKFEMSFDAWGNRRDPATWVNYTTTLPDFIIDRGFTGHEHYDEFGLINMNGRVYDPVIARFLSPDSYVQAPELAQNYNGYVYCLNNPLIYTDPSGEIVWFVPIIIGAAVFGTGNLAAHVIRGDVDDFRDGLKYFGQGALAGAALGAAWQFAPLIPGIGQTIQTGMNIYGAVHIGGAAISTVSGLGQGVFTGDWSALGNASEIFLGNFYLDENGSFFGNVWQGISRHTWEFPQTGLGHTWTQLRNTFGAVDRVDYFGGATFVTRENQDGRKGMSLGNFINISISDEMESDFDARVISDPLFMHEYGHTFDSQFFGISYLFSIGLPSIISATRASQVPGEPMGVSTHDFRWYEMSANRHAERYFSKNFGVNWLSLYRSGTIETYYPRRRR